ncbi:MAG: hypothetical protein WD607_11690 [Candidatus Paceibacterota bacterium]
MKNLSILYLFVIFFTLLIFLAYLPEDLPYEVSIFEFCVILSSFVLSCGCLAALTNKATKSVYKETDIKLGRMFQIVKKHKTSNDNNMYLIKEEEDTVFYHLNSKMNLGEEGEKFIMGKYNNELHSFTA